MQNMRAHRACRTPANAIWVRSRELTGSGASRERSAAGLRASAQPTAMSVSPPPARSSLENLLLAQAVYQNGSQDWAFICSLLNGHPLTPYGDRIEGGWSEAVSPTSRPTPPSPPPSHPS